MTSVNACVCLVGFTCQGWDNEKHVPHGAQSGPSSGWEAERGGLGLKGLMRC